MKPLAIDLQVQWLIVGHIKLFPSWRLHQRAAANTELPPHRMWGFGGRDLCCGFTESQIVVEAGRDFQRSSGPPPAQAGAPRAGCPGSCLVGFLLPLRRVHHCPGQLVPVLSLHGKCFLMSSWILLSFSLCQLPLLLSKLRRGGELRRRLED